MVRIDDPTPEAIGAGVRAGMAQSVDGLDADVPDFKKHRSFRATGTRSWRAFERGSQMVGVSSEPGKVIVAPIARQKEEERSLFGRSSLTTTHPTASWGSVSWRRSPRWRPGRGQGLVAGSGVSILVTWATVRGVGRRSEPRRRVGRPAPWGRRSVVCRSGRRRRRPSLCLGWGVCLRPGGCGR